MCGGRVDGAEPSTELEVGTVLVVLGEAKNVARLRSLVNEDSEPLSMRAP